MGPSFYTGLDNVPMFKPVNENKELITRQFWFWPNSVKVGIVFGGGSVVVYSLFIVAGGSVFGPCFAFST